VIPGQHVASGYFSQDHAEQLEPRGSVLDAVYQAAPGWTIHQVRNLLGALLFSQEDAFKPMATLSGGERARVALARILLRPTNLLLLDEPTNHLDLATREALEAALRAYPGTLVFATHDRYLAEQLATRVWEVADGAVHGYRGNYSAYRRQRDARLKAKAAPIASTSKQRSGPKPNGRDDRAMERELARLEEQITAAEQAIAHLERQLTDPAHYGDAEQAAEMGLEYASRRAELDTLNRRWEELAEAVLREA
jgi:ATP-binding cassette subfamily F protein 3